MQKLDRTIQEQIQRAVREELGRVKTVETARTASFGVPDLSSQISAPTLMWRKETYNFPLGVSGANPALSDVLASLNYSISANRTVTLEPGQLEGGINTTLSAGMLDPNVASKGVTQVFKTKIYTASERIFTTKLILDASIFLDKPHPIGWYDSACMFAVGVKPDTDTLWTKSHISFYYQISNSRSMNQGLYVRFPGGTWTTLAFYIYLGFPFAINVRELFKGIVYHFDSSQFVDRTPPSPPSWGPTPLQSDYINESLGDCKNILTIKTPTESDWLGVGIYRATRRTRTDVVAGPASGSLGSEIIFATTAGRIDLGRVYTSTAYNDTALPAFTNSFSFLREEPYQKNLIVNGGFFYNTANWRFEDGGPAADDGIRAVIFQPWTPPRCVKSSASYSGASKFNMVIQSSSFPINKFKDYNLAWHVKPEYVTGSSKSVSAVQINYYSSITRTACVSTPYQIYGMNYGGTYNSWTRYDKHIYSTMYEASVNPNRVIGASALSHFVIPSDCTYADIKFKMHHNHSAPGVFFFDGASIQVDSGQSFTYDSYSSPGTVAISRERLTSIEHTAYSILRLPLRGSGIAHPGHRKREVLWGHSTTAFGPELYRSSAHWAKFAQGIEVGAAAVNRALNGGFKAWGGSGYNQKPISWDRFTIGSDPVPLTYPASTAVYGNTSLAIYWGTVDAGGSGLYQQWSGTDKKRVWYSFWLYLDTGAIKIGDLNKVGQIAYKQPVAYWYTTYTRGYNDSGPPHQSTNEVVVPQRQWTYQQIFMSTANILHFWSNVKGTFAYVDGVQINQNAQANGAVYPIPTMYDPVRIIAGATAHPTSYVHCSANAINADIHTIRCWFSPAHDWRMKSTTTGTIGSHIPKPVVWYLGQDPSATSDWEMLYYRPFVTENSANPTTGGGFFEFSARKWTGSSIREWWLPGKRIAFNAFDPMHLVLTWCGGLNTTGDIGKYTKLYVNGIQSSSSDTKALYGASGYWYNQSTGLTMDRADHIVLGAIRGVETVTATPIDWFVAGMQDTAFGQANGVISEFRVDNYIWSQEQVLEDFMAQKPKYHR